MNLSTKIELLPDPIQYIFHIAGAYVREYSNELLAPEHLLKAILHKDVGLIPYLESSGKDYYYLLDWADVRIDLLPKVSNPPSELSVSEETNAVLRAAEDYGEQYGIDEVTPLLLLAAVATPGAGFSYEQLKSFPVRRDEVLDALGQPIASTEPASSSSMQNAFSGKSPGHYIINKNQEARDGKLPGIIGFDKEVQSIFETLGRKNKSNILIIGESGVGKTALIDAFVQRIVSGEAPGFLRNAVVYELDVTALSSEASYKGEIEDRMKKILVGLRSEENAILVVENLDKFFEKNESLYGLSSLLKREIIKENLRLITTSSIEGFTKNIEPDKEFLRLIEKMTLEEPDPDTAFRIVSGVKSRYETYYGLSLPDEVISEAIRLVKRYMGERSLPDSAFDLIDRTLSHINTMNDISEKEIEILKQKLDGFSEPAGSDNREIARELGWLHSEISHRLSLLLIAQLSEETDFHKLTGKEEKIEYINRTLNKLSELVKNKRNHIEPTDLSVIIAKQTGVPVGKLQSGERDKLLNAENILKQRVVGQDHAIRIVLDALYESRSGLNRKGQPMASVFFLGPTGTGKTELTKALAEFLFQDESAIIRFDMSEFMEAHSVATMTGAPAGYVGYEEGGLLVNKIRQKPYSIVLFDEIEKAHPDVFNIFLQIMDEGRIHDKLNRTGDFSNSLVIFTSNVGSDYIFKSFDAGIIPSSNELKKLMIEKRFKPEFLGRLSEVIPFSPITKEIVLMIFDIHLRNLLKTLGEMDIRLNISDEAREYLALSEFSPELGARPIIGIIRNEIRRPLSKLIISGKVTPGSEVNLSFEDGKIVWN